MINAMDILKELTDERDELREILADWDIPLPELEKRLEAVNEEIDTINRKIKAVT